MSAPSASFFKDLAVVKIGDGHPRVIVRVLQAQPLRVFAGKDGDREIVYTEPEASMLNLETADFRRGTFLGRVESALPELLAIAGLEPAAIRPGEFHAFEAGPDC